MVVVANKLDLKRAVSRQEGFEWAVKHGFSYKEVSAQTGSGIEDLVCSILDCIDSIKEDRDTCETSKSRGSRESIIT